MTKTLLSILLCITFQLSYAQCVENGTNFGNQTVPSYRVTGDVTVTLNSNNTVSLDLGSNFMTADGPDVRAYLINSQGMSDSQLQNARISNLTNIPFGLVGCTNCSPSISANGEKSFTVDIPAGEDIRDYDKIFFYCLQFNAFWDFGSIEPFTSTNCSVLNVNTSEIATNFKIYPNPAKRNLTFENNKKLPVTISIYNVLGSEVIHIDESSVSKININIAQLKAGMYLLKTVSGQAFKTTRFIKE